MTVFIFQCFENVIPFPPACRVSAEKSAGSLSGVPLSVTFKILSLSLIFDNFSIICLGEGLFALR